MPEPTPYEGDKYSHRVSIGGGSGPDGGAEEVLRVRLAIPHPPPRDGLPQARAQPVLAVQIFDANVSPVGCGKAHRVGPGGLAGGSDNRFQNTRNSSLVVRFRRSFPVFFSGCNRSAGFRCGGGICAQVKPASLSSPDTFGRETGLQSRLLQNHAPCRFSFHCFDPVSFPIQPNDRNCVCA